VSHRQSILMQADRILALRDGTVERFGPRSEVLRELMPARHRDGFAPAILAGSTEQRAAS
jgi:ABC-type protease/lipase transport system fused ATPase/permease subunit